MTLDTWVVTDAGMRSLGSGATVTGGLGPHKMQIGMCSSPLDEPSWLALESQVGRMGLRRTFSPGLPSTAPAKVRQDYGKRTSWHSVKANWVEMANGNHDSTVTSFLNSIPSDHELWLTFYHEPENIYPLGEEPARSAEWRAAQHHFYDLVKSVRPATLVGPILMGWTFDPASGRSPANWTVDADKCDFYGVDEYNPYYFPMVGNRDTWVSQPTQQMRDFVTLCRQLDVAPAVGEVASSEYYGAWSGSRKAEWINQLIDYTVAEKFIGVCWFDVYTPNDTSEDMLIDSSQASLDAWAGHVSQHQRGVK